MLGDSGKQALNNPIAWECGSRRLEMSLSSRGKKLFKSIDEAHGIAGVFLRGRKRVSAVIVKLNRTPSMLA
jgi:hypothetical protein